MRVRQYLLDTNICIWFLKNRCHVREAIIKADPDNCFISEITIAELYYGACKSSRKEERLKDVEFVMKHFKVLPIFPALPLFGDIRAELESKGLRIDDFDLLIGATAIANDLIVVSDNIKHLGRLPNIRVENWVDRTEGK